MNYLNAQSGELAKGILATAAGHTPGEYQTAIDRVVVQILKKGLVFCDCKS